jgi:K+-sensing histidine kinase KdpD
VFLPHIHVSQQCGCNGYNFISMLQNQNDRLRRAVGQSLSGGIAIALLTVVCSQLHFSFAATACIYLMIVVLVSMRGHFFSSALASFMAVGCLAYYFAPPIFSLRVRNPFHVAAMVTFFHNFSSHHSLGVQKARVGRGSRV